VTSTRVVSVSDLLDLLEALLAKSQSDQSQRGRPLSFSQFCQAQTTSGNEPCWEVRPTGPLLVVVKFVKHRRSLHFAAPTTVKW
jgi:hypothetical protein